MTTIKSVDGRLHIIERSLTGDELALDAALLQEQTTFGDTVSISRDDEGRIISIVASLPGSLGDRTVTLSRDSAGRVSSIRVRYSGLAIDKTYTFVRDTMGKVQLFTFNDSP